MTRYLSRRLLQTVVTVVGASFLFFSAVTVLPGDPIRGLFGVERPPPEMLEQLREQFHLDRPFLVQYGLFLGDLATGDLGNSLPYDPRARRVGPPVRSILAGAAPVSLRILGAAVALQLVVGIGGGVLATLHRRRPLGWLLYGLAIVVVSIPVIVVAFAVQDLLGLRFRLVPITWTGGGAAYVLPVLALTTAATAYVTLLTRSELVETLHERFVKAAEARAVPPRRVIGVHALRASLLPAVTFVAANLGHLISGLIVVEGVFHVPGVGGVLFRAIQVQDRTLLVVTITLLTILVSVANLLADLLYGVIDPRVRADA